MHVFDIQWREDEYTPELVRRVCREAIAEIERAIRSPLNWRLIDAKNADEVRRWYNRYRMVKEDLPMYRKVLQLTDEKLNAVWCKGEFGRQHRPVSVLAIYDQIRPKKYASRQSNAIMAVKRAAEAAQRKEVERIADNFWNERRKEKRWKLGADVNFRELARVAVKWQSAVSPEVWAELWKRREGLRICPGFKSWIGMNARYPHTISAGTRERVTLALFRELGIKINWKLSKINKR